ncbi:MAG: metallophosphoesterase [Clostridia bacterium]|nr:metallophosphoesterase [Clostridia bacterium]
MKLLVISDTHGYIGNAVSAIEKEQPDYILHLGDVADDCDELMNIYPNKLVVCVLGNNDFFNKKYPLERIFSLCGKNIFMCHGHKYNVKQSLFPLKKAAQYAKAHIVLYGHTHRSYLEQDGDMLIMNPGSISSYGIIDITDDGTNAEIINF